MSTRSRTLQGMGSHRVMKQGPTPTMMTKSHPRPYTPLSALTNPDYCPATPTSRSSYRRLQVAVSLGYHETRNAVTVFAYLPAHKCPS